MDNILAKWRIRGRKSQDIVLDTSTGAIENADWTMVERWREEFQREFCASCVEFDQKKKRFREKGRDYFPEDCKWHYTDMAGQCHNFKPVPNAAKLPPAYASAAGT